MAKQLLDQKIGSTGLSVGIQSDEHGNLGIELEYPIQKLEAPLTALLTKLAAKVPFLSRYVAPAVAGLMAAIGYQAPPAVAAPAADETAEPVQAHEAAPVEAAPVQG